ncbi:MAG: TlpA disulfide reductase family protein [candidate division WOR-3 bacterium]
MKNVLISAVLVVFLIGCGGGSTKPSSPQISNKYDFTLESMQGDKVTLSALKGKVVILDFWATWCPPCRAAIPKLIELYNKYRNQGLLILGIALDERDKVVKLSKEMEINYPVLFDDKVTSKNYEIQSIPTLFVIDKKGKQVHKEIGFSEEGFQEIEEKIVQLLAE